MFKNKYLTLAIFILLIFLAIKQYNNDVKNGKIQGVRLEKKISESYEKVAQILKEYREVEKADNKDNWADELGINVKPLLKGENPGIFTEKAADMMQNFLRTKKGMEMFERLLLTPPDSDGSVDILGLNRSASIPYFNISRFDKKLGKGAPLECGQRVSFKYSARLQGTKEIHNVNEEKPEVTRIGDFKYIPGIEYSLIGMRAGGERDLIIPPSQAYGVGSKLFDDNLANKFVLAHIEVIRNLSKEPDYRGFNIASETEATGKDLILCGDRVKIEYQIFNQAMKPISNKLSKEIILGHYDLPIGIIKTIEGISSGEERRADLPKSVRNTYDGKESSFFNNLPPLPNDIILKIYSAKKIPLDEQ